MAAPSQLEVTEAELEQARARLLAHQEYEETEEGMYGSYYPGPNYGSVPVVLPSTVIRPQSSAKKRARSRQQQRRRYRVPFLILLLFDCGLIIFLSIICSEKPLSDDQTWSVSRYFNFNVHKTYFDLVFLAIVRLVLDTLFYLIMEWITRLIMALTLVLSTFYVPVKAFYLWKELDEDHLEESIPILLIVVVAFVMPWFEALFFEFKYLPAELSRLDIETWWDWRAWLWPRGLPKADEEEPQTPSLPEVATVYAPRHFVRTPTRPYSSSNLSLEFRTPLGSFRGSPVPGDYERFGDEDLPPIREEGSPLSPVVDLHDEEEHELSEQDQRFTQEGEQALEALMKLYNTQTGWSLEKDTGDIQCFSKPGKRRKIFRGETVVDLRIHTLWTLLYPGEQMSEWSPQCAINEVVYRVTDNTDILYTATNQVGPVSSRDFVSTRRIAVRGGIYYAASMATVTDMKPVQTGRVRGQNGPCGYVLVPVSPTRTKFVWFIDSDLKGWLPQTVVDQNVSGTIITTLQKLREFIHQQKTEGRLRL